VNENYYNKIYFDINKEGKITKKLNFKNSKLILSTDLDISFNLKTATIEDNQNEINAIIDKSMTKIDYNELVQKPLTKDELANLNDLLPLNIYDFKGAQSQFSINVSNLLTGAHRFVSNYPKPEFIFSHINNEIMIIDNIIISSDLAPKSIETPFGEGLIFLMNSLDNVDKAKENFSNFTYEDFEKFLKEKKSNNEDLYEFEPVCYIKMDKNEIVISNVLKNKKCKFIYFIPTNGRDGNIQNFEKSMMSILFFGVQGKVTNSILENIAEDKRNYIFSKFGKNSFVDNLSIEIYGYSNKSNERILIGKKDKFQINDILLDRDLDSEFYLSKNILNNSDKKGFESIEIEINNNLSEKDLFEAINISISFTTFKALKNEEEKTDDKNNNVYANLVSQFYKLVLNQNLFEEFITKFIPLLVDRSYDKNKRLAILKYFNSLFIKRKER